MIEQMNRWHSRRSSRSRAKQNHQWNQSNCTSQPLQTFVFSSTAGSLPKPVCKLNTLTLVSRYLLSHEKQDRWKKLQCVRWIPAPLMRGFSRTQAGGSCITSTGVSTLSACIHSLQLLDSQEWRAASGEVGSLLRGKTHWADITVSSQMFQSSLVPKLHIYILNKLLDRNHVALKSTGSFPLQQSRIFLTGVNPTDVTHLLNVYHHLDQLHSSVRDNFFLQSSTKLTF